MSRWDATPLLVCGGPAVSEPLRAIFQGIHGDLGGWAPPALERPARSEPTSSGGVALFQTTALGHEALARVQEQKASGQPFPIVFVALRLASGWDGVMTIQQLWREQPDLQIVLCRDPGDGTWEGISNRLGQTDALVILTAPFDPVTVQQTVCAMSRKWAAGRRADERSDELKKAQRQVQAVIDYLPSPICLRDLEGRFLLTNGAFRQRFKTTSEAVFGRRPDAALPAKIAWLFTPLDDQAVQGNRPVEFEVAQPILGDQPATAWLVSKWPLHGHDGLPYAICSLFTDLSRRQAEEEHLRHGLALRSQVRMAAEIGHQFGNLLTILGGHAEVAQRRLGPDHPARAALDGVLASVAKGTDLTRQLTIFGRRGALHLSEVDLRTVVTAQAEILRGVLPVGQEVRVEVPDEEVMVRIDPSQFAASLLDVALGTGDALPVGAPVPGCISLSLRRTVSAGIAQAELWIGHPHAGYAQISNPFAGPGDGGHLGLAAARVLCEQLGGTANKRAEQPGREALVLAIPLVQHAEVSEIPPLPNLGPVTVLVAEDERSVRELVAEVLREAGYRVLVASDGQEALGIAWSSTVPIDLLVTDSIMPRLDGLALADKILTRHPATKVLIMSGYTESGAVRNGMRRVGAQFIQKPFSIDGLLASVSDLLGPRTPRSETMLMRTPMHGLPVLPER